MKKEKIMTMKSKILIGISLAIPLYLLADGMMMRDFGLNDRPKVNTTQSIHLQYNCPTGWTKTLDITNDKSKWYEASPVLTCKPDGNIMNCPPQTYFYISENAQNSNGVEMGCKTSVW